MSPIDTILSRLEGQRLKRTGNSSWVACCPAHEDRTPSLSIREAEGGKVLIHCHGGCGVDSVVGAMGLALSDLFPPEQGQQYGQRQRKHRTLDYRQCLELVKFETTLVLTAALNLASGHQLTAEDLERLKVAASRIEAAMGEAGV